MKLQEFKELSDNLTNVSMTVDYEMPLGPLGNILDSKICKIC